MALRKPDFGNPILSTPESDAMMTQTKLLPSIVAALLLSVWLPGCGKRSEGRRCKKTSQCEEGLECVEWGEHYEAVLRKCSGDKCCAGDDARYEVEGRRTKVADGGGDESPAGKAERCAPLEVTVDGKEVKLAHGLARYEPDAKAEADGTHSLAGWSVAVFDHDKVTCGDFLARQRSIPSGETTVRAYVPDNGRVRTVGIGVHSQMVRHARLETSSETVGDKVAICVTEPTVFTPVIGDFKGKPVSIQGLIEGKFCGKRE